MESRKRSLQNPSPDLAGTCDEWQPGARKFLAGGFCLIVDGTFPRIARVESELHDAVEDPRAAVSALRNGRRPRADLFTFMQRIPDTKRKFPGLHMEWDNLAAVRVTTFEHWWKKQINDKTRNLARQLEKKGGQVRISELDAAFVAGISAVYNETPIRRDRKFWHYGKSLETVEAENATYADRSVFIGAYYEDTLIGFVKLVCEPAFASLMQVISMIEHRDKSPTNALLAKAVEVCADRGIPYLVYAKYVYGRKGADSLTAFKRRNGFERIDLPRYYIPLTLRGRLTLALGLHRGLRELLPKWLVLRLLDLRAKRNARRMTKARGGRDASHRPA
jgi:hypothetical protein